MAIFFRNITEISQRLKALSDFFYDAAVYSTRRLLDTVHFGMEKY